MASKKNNNNTAVSAKKSWKRNPRATRELILETAGKLLARDGPEALSITELVQHAGINRGTVYHHFKSREQLLDATMAWVSSRLCEAAFGDIESQGWNERSNPQLIIDRIMEFVLEHPEFGPSWIFRFVIEGREDRDPFWQQLKAHIDEFAHSEFAEPDIDTEIYTFLMLVGLFLWPQWVNSHSSSVKKRRELVDRLRKEMLRLSIHGVVHKPIQN